MVVKGTRLPEGDIITIDGGTGEVMLGADRDDRAGCCPAISGR